MRGLTPGLGLVSGGRNSSAHSRASSSLKLLDNATLAIVEIYSLDGGYVDLEEYLHEPSSSAAADAAVRAVASPEWSLSTGPDGVLDFNDEFSMSYILGRLAVRPEFFSFQEIILEDGGGGGATTTTTSGPRRVLIPGVNLLKYVHTDSYGRDKYRKLEDVIVSSDWEPLEYSSGEDPHPTIPRRPLVEVKEDDRDNVFTAAKRLLSYTLPGYDTQSLILEMIARVIIGLSNKANPDLDVLTPIMRMKWHPLIDDMPFPRFIAQLRKVIMVPKSKGEKFRYDEQRREEFCRRLALEVLFPHHEFPPGSIPEKLTSEQAGLITSLLGYGPRIDNVLSKKSGTQPTAGSGGGIRPPPGGGVPPPTPRVSSIVADDSSSILSQSLKKLSSQWKKPIEARNFRDEYYYFRCLHDSYYFSRCQNPDFLRWQELDPVTYHRHLLSAPDEFFEIFALKEKYGGEKMPPDLKKDHDSILNARRLFVDFAKIESERWRRKRYVDMIWPILPASRKKLGYTKVVVSGRGGGQGGGSGGGGGDVRKLQNLLQMALQTKPHNYRQRFRQFVFSLRREILQERWLQSKGLSDPEAVEELIHSSWSEYDYLIYRDNVVRIVDYLPKVNLPRNPSSHVFFGLKDSDSLYWAQQYRFEEDLRLRGIIPGREARNDYQQSEYLSQRDWWPEWDSRDGSSSSDGWGGGRSLEEEEEELLWSQPPQYSSRPDVHQVITPLRRQPTTYQGGTSNITSSGLSWNDEVMMRYQETRRAHSGSAQTPATMAMMAAPAQTFTPAMNLPTRAPQKSPLRAPLKVRFATVVEPTMSSEKIGPALETAHPAGVVVTTLATKATTLDDLTAQPLPKNATTLTQTTRSDPRSPLNLTAVPTTLRYLTPSTESYQGGSSSTRSESSPSQNESTTPLSEGSTPQGSGGYLSRKNDISSLTGAWKAAWETTRSSRGAASSQGGASPSHSGVQRGVVSAKGSSPSAYSTPYNYDMSMYALTHPVYPVSAPVYEMYSLPATTPTAAPTLNYQRWAPQPGPSRVAYPYNTHQYTIATRPSTAPLGSLPPLNVVKTASPSDNYSHSENLMLHQSYVMPTQAAATTAKLTTPTPARIAVPPQMEAMIRSTSAPPTQVAALAPSADASPRVVEATARSTEAPPTQIAAAVRSTEAPPRLVEATPSTDVASPSPVLEPTPPAPVLDLTTSGGAFYDGGGHRSVRSVTIRTTPTLSKHRKSRRSQTEPKTKVPDNQ